MELAIFVDDVAYNSFFSFLDEDKEKIRNIILAYINGIQAVLHHPSFGVPIDISLIYLEIMEKQPSDLPLSSHGSTLLNTFCEYTKFHNPPDDNNPHHWDIGLYITGIDLYSNKEDKWIYEMNGLAYVGTLCSNKSYAIAEFSIQSNKPRITAGFDSIYIAAHKIGHVLGMRHDSENNTCPKRKYIINTSPSGFREQTTWSKCSLEIAKKQGRRNLVF